MADGSIGRVADRVTAATGDNGSADLFTDLRHPDPLTITQHLREVERLAVGIEGQAACRIDRVRNSGTDTKLVDTRMEDRTVDMHDNDRRNGGGRRIV